MPTTAAPTRSVPAGPDRPAGWALARPAVVRAVAAPPGTVTLADLATGTAAERLTATARTDDGRPLPRTRRALTPVHLAVDVVTTVVAAPSALDGLVVRAAPEQVGAVLADDAGRPPVLTGFWVAADVAVATAPTGAAAGAVARALLEPVLALARGRGRISRRTTDALVEDSLLARGRHHQRFTPDPLWLNAFLDGAGYGSPRPHRVVTSPADDGPPVAVPGRRVCCILASTPAPDSCPTCPLHPRDTQVRLVAEWLREVDDVDFDRIAGRPRVGCSA